jgi:UDP-N-acetylglucosamine/UDP-N-acetylgalactosamine 4-epimerase
MTSRYSAVQDELRAAPRRWLVTGAAGFIGSNLLETLLRLGQHVVGLDNFSTGHRHNLEDVRRSVGADAWSRFSMIEGDIRDLDSCVAACRDAEIVLHQAALGSVPRSIDDPLTSHAANVDGFLNLLVAARDAQVRRFVYAASSSTYGDHPGLPKVEDQIGRPLSPYAVTKYVNELYAGVFERTYGIETVGLRYFNVFGPRQDPNGAYAAVIPRWIGRLLNGEHCTIYGDGETSRDFCYVANAVQANLLAAVAQGEGVTDQVYNVAVGERTTLSRLFELIRESLHELAPELPTTAPAYAGFRSGDVRHSLADITKIATRLGYQPTHTVGAGMAETLAWFLATTAPAAANDPTTGSVPAATR